jgi:cysteine-rich repeat protein
VFLTPSGSFTRRPGGWTCAEAAYDDNVCDCGCEADDADCTTSTFEGCERSACKAGQVPWEHAPASCMSSTCGDGWNDVAGGEVCDDGEALAGGGCSADCKTVNAGYTCGALAHKCTMAASEEAAPIFEPGPEVVEVVEEVEAEVAEVVETTPGKAEGGGCATGAEVPLLALMALGLRRRRSATV